MGMLIDDHIEVLKSYSHGFTGYAGNLQNSINVAIDTMRKYQKIEDIYYQSGEAIPKANVYKAIQEMMKYEHEGFINISLARLDEILKKCGVSEDGKID